MKELRRKTHSQFMHYRKNIVVEIGGGQHTVPLSDDPKSDIQSFANLPLVPKQRGKNSQGASGSRRDFIRNENKD